MKLNKKQKRTATIASMAALLAVVLGMGGQTFAKYITTTAAPTQSAVVAKWGVVIQSLGNDTENSSSFKKDYDGTVVSTDTVVAPGTSGSLTFNVTGTPEVDTDITVAITVTSEIKLDTYKPIVWKINTTEYADLAAVSTAIAKTTRYEAGAGVTGASFTLSWEWPFETGADAATKKENNIKDSKLGDLAANISKEDYEKKYAGSSYDTDKAAASTELTFDISVTAEQVN